VNGDDLGFLVLLDNLSKSERPASRTCWRTALINLRSSKLADSCSSAGVSTPKLRTNTKPSTMRVLIPSGPRPTNSCWKAIISSLMVLCRRFMSVSLHLLFLMVQPTTTAGATPLHPQRDAVTGPGSAGRTEKVPEETAEM
jgi:hypothetical protein